MSIGYYKTGILILTVIGVAFAGLTYFKSQEASSAVSNGTHQEITPFTTHGSKSPIIMDNSGSVTIK